uniref:Transposase, MuDR, MULE transposase domain protein n=1 Tax=Tanacetum cinerariifolium TaxID=118510 RepID=A0A6L2JMQ7_TANCI|nr:transposase, MuDR, MULE transposase domain protein [Tanacetum cinerariifolium]
MPDPPDAPTYSMKTIRQETLNGKRYGIMKEEDDFDNKAHCMYEIGKKALDEGFEFKTRKLETLRHLMINCKMKSEKLQAIYWKTCKAYTPEEFQRRITYLCSFRLKAYKKLEDARFETWSRAMCPANRYSYMTSNSDESINNLIRHVRKVPVTKLMEWYKALLYCDHREKYKGMIVSQVEEYEVAYNNNNGRSQEYATTYNNKNKRSQEYEYEASYNNNNGRSQEYTGANNNNYRRTQEYEYKAAYNNNNGRSQEYVGAYNNNYRRSQEYDGAYFNEMYD